MRGCAIPASLRESARKRSSPLLIARGIVFGGAALACFGCERADRSGASGSSAAEPLRSEALEASATAPSGSFSLLPSDATGIDFTYRWDPADDELRSAAYTQFGGGGVAIGDYDSDGRADVYLSRPHTGGRLYRNLGGWKFEDVTEAAGLGSDTEWSAGCTFADIDGDGDLDLHVCGFDAPNRMFVNRGDGTFADEAPALGLDVKGSSVTMAFADYDRDGDLDGYLVRNRYKYDFLGRPFQTEGRAEIIRDPVSGGMRIAPEWEEQFDVLVRGDTGEPLLIPVGQENKLFRNDGADGFESVAIPAGVADKGLSLAAVWWDCDHDGWPDLYVANDYFGPDRLYRNGGDGTFEDIAPAAFPHTPWFSMGVDVGDINNDGLLDFIATDMAGTTHYKSKLGMGDMDSQGWFLEMGSPRQYMRNALYLNSGAGRFMEIAQQAGVAASDWTWAPKLADLDCDGWMDLFVANGMTGDFTNSDLKAEAPNGIVKLEQTEPKRDRNMAFRNAGQGFRFENVGAAWNLDRESVSFGAAYGDLDNDGDLDLVVNNWNEECSVYRNDAASGNRVKIRLVGTSSNRWGIDSLVTLTAGGRTQTRYLTLSRGFMSSDEPLVYFGLGDANRIDAVEVRWPSGRRQQLHDLEANRLYVITEPSGEATPAAIEETPPSPLFARSSAADAIRHQENAFDDFAVQPLLPNRLSQLGPAMAVGDVDGDGADDVFLGGAAGSSGQLFLWRDGKFAPASESAAVFENDRDGEDIDAALVDLDGDGDLDLYVVSGGYEFEPDDPRLADRLYLNDGTGSFEAALEGAVPQFTDSGGTVAAGDFDGDGDVDLFVGGRVVPGGYPATPRSRLLRSDGEPGSIRFVDVTEEVAPDLAETGLVTDALWSDADGDGALDLLVTHEWGPVKLFRSRGGKLEDASADAGLADRLGWWNAIAAADVDADGDTDYVATNFGLNTKYHPSPEKPTFIYYGDFEGSGSPQIVEASQKEGRLLPVRGKSCSQNAMPFLRQKFPTFHEFAVSSLQEIYPQTELEDALKVTATELRHGILVNDGAGKFDFAPLPDEAQIAPSLDAVFTDVDGDGREDLYLVHNFFSPQRETGRMNGGLSVLLMGKGTGEFIPLRPDRSGLVLPGDTRAVAATDINRDGATDFIVAVNDGPAAAFVRARSAPSAPPR